jgi:hypothetical protein
MVNFGRKLWENEMKELKKLLKERGAPAKDVFLVEYIGRNYSDENGGFTWIRKWFSNKEDAMTCWLNQRDFAAEIYHYEFESKRMMVWYLD